MVLYYSSQQERRRSQPRQSLCECKGLYLCLTTGLPMKPKCIMVLFLDSDLQKSLLQISTDCHWMKPTTNQYTPKFCLQRWASMKTIIEWWYFRTFLGWSVINNSKFGTISIPANQRLVRGINFTFVWLFWSNFYEVLESDLRWSCYIPLYRCWTCDSASALATPTVGYCLACRSEEVDGYPSRVTLSRTNRQDQALVAL